MASNLSTLPNDAIFAILCTLPDLVDLKAAILSCKALLAVFQGSRALVLGKVCINHIKKYEVPVQDLVCRPAPQKGHDGKKPAYTINLRDMLKCSVTQTQNSEVLLAAIITYHLPQEKITVHHLFQLKRVFDICKDNGRSAIRELITATVKLWEYFRPLLLKPGEEGKRLLIGDRALQLITTLSSHFYHSGCYDYAIDVLQTVLDYRKQDDLASRLMDLYRQLSRREEAIKYANLQLEKANARSSATSGRLTKFDADFLTWARYLVQLYCESRKPDAAIQLQEHILDQCMDAPNFDTPQLVAWARTLIKRLKRLDRHREAVQVRRQVFEQHLSFPSRYGNIFFAWATELANEYRLLGEREKAVDVYCKVWTMLLGYFRLHSRDGIVAQHAKNLAWSLTRALNEAGKTSEAKDVEHEWTKIERRVHGAQCGYSETMPQNRGQLVYGQLLRT